LRSALLVRNVPERTAHSPQVLWSNAIGEGDSSAGYMGQLPVVGMPKSLAGFRRRLDQLRRSLAFPSDVIRILDTRVFQFGTPEVLPGCHTLRTGIRTMAYIGPD
jgi:hypothetical protein